MRGFFLQINGDLRGFAALAAQAADADRRAQRVQVCHLVPHDEDLARLGDELRKRACNDSRFDSGATFGFLGSAAVEGEIVAVLDHSLIAAAGERHLDGKVGKRVVFFKRASVLADAKRNGCIDARGICHGADGVENRELALLKSGKGLALEQKQIPVALDLAAERMQTRDPAGDGLVDLRVQLRDGRVRQIAHQLVIVIDENDRGDGARA